LKQFSNADRVEKAAEPMEDRETAKSSEEEDQGNERHCGVQSSDVSHKQLKVFSVHLFDHLKDLSVGFWSTRT